MADPQAGTAPVLRVLIVGNPNAGKSTLFNALTGGGARVGNFAGTTVDKTLGRMRVAGRTVEMVDIPGTFSLAARSPEERIAIDAILGLNGQEAPDALVVVCDAPRLARSLYLTVQLLELEVPIVVALNLMDEARADGVAPDADALSEVLGVPVVATVARTGEGQSALVEALGEVLDAPDTARPGAPHEWSNAMISDADRIADALPEAWRVRAGTETRIRALALWCLLSVDDDPPAGMPENLRSALRGVLDDAVADGRDLQTELVGGRYTWIDARVPAVVSGPPVLHPREERLDRVLLHPVWGGLAFLTVMGLVFIALFAWADPMIGGIESAVGMLGAVVGSAFVWLSGTLPAWSGVIDLVGAFTVEGLIGGVGAVVVFLPQIGLLFLFLALLEDCGYLSRAAHLMDRILRAAGLPGRAFVPLLSGYACAVPAIMATRSMPRFRDRLLTMLVVPLTSCSARLPVYTLMIAALFPPTLAGTILPLRPMILFGLYLFSTAVTLAAALVMGRLLLPDAATPALLELPPYRIPDPRTVARSVIARCGDFLREAGGIILWATIVLWALLSFPQYEPSDLLPAEVVAVESAETLEALAAPLALERSYAGQLGQAMEPAIRPLGYDWKIGVGLIGAFAAREVFVSTMGLVYGIGDGVDEQDVALRERIREEKHADGTPVYTPLVGASLLVFFALAMQCLSTLAVIRKETRSWRWPAFVFVYMTSLAWVSAFAVYQGGRLLGLG